MTEPEHSVDRLLRELASSPTPKPGDRERGRVRLDAAIRAEEARRVTRFPLGSLRWAAALIVVAVGVLVLVQAGGGSPAAAAIGEIAEVARELDPIAPSDTAFVYTASDSTALMNVPVEGLGGVPYGRDELLYLLPVLRESWFGNDNTVKIRSVAGEPSFFNLDDRDVYAAAGIDQQDQIGIPVTSVVELVPEFWPADPTELDSVIRDAMATDRGVPEAVEYLDVALDIVRESFASPEVRSATLDLIGELDGLELGEPRSEGASAFYIEYSDSGVDVRYSFAIDNSGYLRFEEILNLTVDVHFGLPADTATYRAEYEAPSLTEMLDSP